jgi:hypothetical protein
MDAPQEKRGPGKPKTVVDLELVYNLAKLHCTNREIASLVGCHVDTLQKRFHDLLDKGRDDGKMTLRRSLWDLALNGKNVTAMIWLSKQHLGFSDHPVSTDDKKPLPWSDDEPETKFIEVDADQVDGEQVDEVEIELTYAAHDQIKENLNSTFRTFGS